MISSDVKCYRTISKYSCEFFYNTIRVFNNFSVLLQVKVLKKPRFDLSRLLELHGDGSGKAAEGVTNVEGVVVERPEGYEPPVQEAV